MLALIAGTGALPTAVATAQDTPPVICALRGFPPDSLEVEITFRLETFGSLLAMLQAREVTEICMCGRIDRPSIDPTALDALTLPLVPRLQAALGQGDDGALRVIIALMEEAGFCVRAAHETAPGLLPAAGVFSATALPDGVAEEAQLGDAALAKMGAADLGQACVIRSGQVIARETDTGTDAMLAGLTNGGPDTSSDPISWAMDTAGDLLGGAADWLSGIDTQKASGFLYKAPKPGQDRRADLPVIGPDTVASVVRAGLAGIVIEAGGVMVLDQPQTRAAADRAGLFLWVRERPAP
ncbi:MAG: UDP-2,3-diacylglucosamine diphosphatase LpxI [Paracoccaceae bacterium]|nr:UDP-2,3-diacylglucosamine diphosphatase LpxI [Paracoccaceae bacterium]